MMPNRMHALESTADRPATRGRIGLDVAVLAGALAFFALLAFFRLIPAWARGWLIGR